MEDTQLKDIEKVIADLRKRFGEAALFPVAGTGHLDVKAVSSGSIALDAALGVGGWPIGRTSEIIGWEGVGKSTLCLHAMKNFQRADERMVAYIDTEHGFDPAYAEALGVDLGQERFQISQPGTTEETMEIIEALVRTGGFSLIVVDSVAGLSPRAEIEGDSGDSNMGLQARLMGQGLRKLKKPLAENETAAIFTNQMRNKLGVMFGSNETTPGGNALKFFASIRAKVNKGKAIKDGEFIIGYIADVFVIKNKVAPPYRKASFDIIHGQGISYQSELLDFGVKLGLVDKRGAFFAYGETRLGQGKEAARSFLAEKPELAAEIEANIRANLSKVSQLGGSLNENEAAEA